MFPSVHITEVSALCRLYEFRSLRVQLSAESLVERRPYYGEVGGEKFDCELSEQKPEAQGELMS